MSRKGKLIRILIAAAFVVAIVCCVTYELNAHNPSGEGRNDAVRKPDDSFCLKFRGEKETMISVSYFDEEKDFVILPFKEMMEFAGAEFDEQNDGMLGMVLDGKEYVVDTQENHLYPINNDEAVDDLFLVPPGWDGHSIIGYTADNEYYVDSDFLRFLFFRYHGIQIDIDKKVIEFT